MQTFRILIRVLILCCLVFLVGCDQLKTLMEQQDETDSVLEPDALITISSDRTVITLAGKAYTYDFASQKLSKASLPSIYAYYDDEEGDEHQWITGTVDQTKGSFTITLPAPPDEALFTQDLFLESEGLTVSNPSVKLTSDILLSINSGEHEADNELICMTKPIILSSTKYSAKNFWPMYASDDCTISGTITMINEEDMKEQTITFQDCSLKKGWNIIQLDETVEKVPNSSYTKENQIATTVNTIPSDAFWRLGKM